MTKTKTAIVAIANITKRREINLSNGRSRASSPTCKEPILQKNGSISYPPTVLYSVVQGKKPQEIIDEYGRSL